MEFILTTPTQSELNVFRYVNRTNGTVSLQYAEVISHAQLDKMGKSKWGDFYVTLRSNAVWGLEAMAIPMIEKLP